MTIAELIAILGTFNPETPVVVTGYQSGYNDIQIIKPVTVQLNTHRQCLNGAYILAHPHIQFHLTKENSPLEAIFLGGYNHLIPDPNL